MTADQVLKLKQLAEDIISNYDSLNSKIDILDKATSEGFAKVDAEIKDLEKELEDSIEEVKDIIDQVIIDYKKYTDDAVAALHAIVNNDLSQLDAKIEKEIKDRISEDESLLAGIGVVNDNLKTEIQNRIDGDEALDEKIEDVQKDLDDYKVVTDAAIAELDSKEKDLNRRVTALEEDTTCEDRYNEVKGLINAEAESRSAEDVILHAKILENKGLIENNTTLINNIKDDLDEKIDIETQNRIDEDDKIIKLLEGEAAVRQADDEILSKRIDALRTEGVETTKDLVRRINEVDDQSKLRDTELENKITDEKTERENQDMILNDKIDEVETESKERDDFLSERIDNVVQELDDSIIEVKDEIDKLDKKVDEEVERLDHRIDLLDVANMSEEILRIENESKARDSKLEGDINEMGEELDFLTGKVGQIEEDVNHNANMCQERDEALGLRIDTIDTTLGELNTKLEEESQERVSTDEELKERIDSLEIDFKEEIENLEQEIADVKKDIEDIGEEITTLKNQLDGHEEVCLERDEALGIRIDNLNNDLREGLLRVGRESQEEYNDLRARIDLLQSEFNKYVEKLESLMAIYDELKDFSDDIVALKAKDINLQEQIDELRAQIDDTSKIVDLIDDKIKDLEDVYATKVELAQAVEDLTTLINSKFDEAKGLIDELRDEVDQIVQTALVEIRTKIEELEAEIDEIKGLIEDIKNNYATKEELKAETTARENADLSINARIDEIELKYDSEIESLKEKDLEHDSEIIDLNSRLADEEEIRQTTDEGLQSQIDDLKHDLETEVGDREAGDATLAESIDSEANTRAEADLIHDGRLDELEARPDWRTDYTINETRNDNGDTLGVNLTGIIDGTTIVKDGNTLRVDRTGLDVYSKSETDTRIEEEIRKTHKWMPQISLTTSFTYNDTDGTIIAPSMANPPDDKFSWLVKVTDVNGVVGMFSYENGTWLNIGGYSDFATEAELTALGHSLNQAISQVSSDLATEVSRSTGKDTEHDGLLSGLRADLGTETSTRISEDSRIEGLINAEVTRSTTQDSTHTSDIAQLRADLTAEATTRASADTALGNRITDHESLTVNTSNGTGPHGIVAASYNTYGLSRVESAYVTGTIANNATSININLPANFYVNDSSILYDTTVWLDPSNNDPRIRIYPTAVTFNQSGSTWRVNLAFNGGFRNAGTLRVKIERVR